MNTEIEYARLNALLNKLKASWLDAFAKTEENKANKAKSEGAKAA